MSDLANDVYGHTVSVTSNGGFDTYVVGGGIEYIFPTGTPQNTALLSITIQSNLLIAKAQVQDYIQSRYTRDQQIQLMIMYEAAVRGSLTNRATYIAQLLTWVNQIVALLATYVASVQALTDVSTIFSTTFDMSTLPADPGVTMLAAIQIAS